jgi:hypothetical protein
VPVRPERLRALPLALLFGAFLAVPAIAQGGRVSFEVAAGRGTNSPIFQHEVAASPSDPSANVTRLLMNDGSIISARLGYRLTGPWILVGELGYGRTEYYYSSFSTSGGRFTGSNEQWGTARRTSFSVGVSRRSALASLPLTIEPELGFAMQWLALGNPGPECGVQPPSYGVPAMCFVSAPWERTYDVPSAGAGLSLGYAIASHVAVSLRGRYAVGRTSTREAFYVKLLPQYAYLEAPTSQTVRSSQLSVGLRIAP